MSKRSSKLLSPDLTAPYVNPYDAPPSPTRNSPRVPLNPPAADYKMLDTVAKNAAYSMKIVVVGDGGCGKTCLLVSYVQQKFPEIYVPTIFENYVSTVRSPTGKLIDLALWDTAGQEEYDRLRPLSYPDTDVILVCFALDNLISLQNVRDTWYPEVSHFCPGIPVVLVGTKSDLPLPFDASLPAEVAREIGAVGYVQCLAKTMSNVRNVFNFALARFQKEQEMQEQVEKLRNRLSRVLGGPPHLRHSSLASYKKHHYKNLSVNLSVLLDAPLTEDAYESNPYKPQTPQPPQPRYNEEEFAFTRTKRRLRKCVIL